MARTTLRTSRDTGQPLLEVSPAQHKLALALVGIFVLPFVVFGLFALVIAFRELSQGDPKQGWIWLGFGVVFTGLPLFLRLAWKRGLRKLAHMGERSAQHPDAPWLWNEDWASGSIPCANKAGLTVAWIFALVWNAISWPLATALPRELERGNHAALVGLLFPLLGVGMLVWAVRSTLRWLRFGASRFEMASVPGVLGGELSGTLHVGEGVASATQFSARLQCIRRKVTGSGKSRATHEKILWSEDAAIPVMALTHGPTGRMLPISFTVPYDCRPSDPLPSDDRILWRLEVRAEIPGVDYFGQFDVPVFETLESDPDLTTEALAKERSAMAPPLEASLPSGVSVRPHPQGGIEVAFPPGRQMGTAAVTSVFAALFGGFAWLCQTQGAPVLFTGAFGGVAALITYGALQLLLGSTRLRAQRSGVELEKRLLFFGTRKHIPAEALERIDLEVGMRSGSRVYWDLRLRTGGTPRRSGKKRRGTRIPSRIADKSQAERLLAAISDALGR